MYRGNKIDFIENLNIYIRKEFNLKIRMAEKGDRNWFFFVSGGLAKGEIIIFIDEAYKDSNYYHYKDKYWLNDTENFEQDVYAAVNDSLIRLK